MNDLPDILKAAAIVVIVAGVLVVLYILGAIAYQAIVLIQYIRDNPESLIAPAVIVVLIGIMANALYKAISGNR